MSEIRLLATGVLGLGFSYQGFQAGLEREPHMLGCDAGSSDFGPYYLGTGLPQKSPLALKRDLELLLAAARKHNIPFITGSTGGAGTLSSGEATAAVVRDIAREKNLRLRVATIGAEIPPALLQRKLREGKLAPLGPAGALDEAAIGRVTRAVGMMGEEPFMRALDMGAEVILAGRAADPAIFAALALREGIAPGVAWHAGKTIDKGSLATTQPLDGSPLLATLRDGDFIVEPTRRESVCTVASVSRVTLHENADPFQITQPTGTIDTQQTVYEQLDARRVRVSGSRYLPAARPTIKIEGAELVGYRTLLIAGIRDPRVIERFDEFLDMYRERLRRNVHAMGIGDSDYFLHFRVFGRDAVMGALEPLASQPGHELGLIVDVVGRTEAISGAIGSKLGPTGSRMDITGKLGGGGNFAYPFSPSLIKVGPAYKWSIWHVIETDEAEMRELFPVTLSDV